jgi:hypothetical protein
MLYTTAKLILQTDDIVSTTVKLRRTFWDNVRKGIAAEEAEQLQHIPTQLEKMTSWCRITKLDLSSCSVSCYQDVGRLAGLLAQCPGRFELNLLGNKVVDERIAAEFVDVC